MRKLIPPLLVVCICLGAKICLQKTKLISPPMSPDLKPILASYQSTSVEKYAFGFNSLIGASIWVQLLQQSDYRPLKTGTVSWEFAQLNTLTTLDPNNNRAFDFGSIFISVLRRDKIGGKILLEKWTKKRPEFWRTWYLLGSHNFLELNDYATAAPLILKASKMQNAPEWLSSLGIRLLSESGQLYQALKTSVELITQIQEPESRGRLESRIRSLNYNIQKRHWEEALSSYLYKNSKLPADLIDLKAEIALKKRELSSLFENEKDSDLVNQILNETFTFKIDTKTRTIASAFPEKTGGLEKTGVYNPSLKQEKTK
ncbi:MAG: hypothetical protein HQ462_01290 [Deltaproteobacteria bacterium]|nr:hypothetical protein [Deltaproteobacteria bacterium]